MTDQHPHDGLYEEGCLFPDECLVATWPHLKHECYTVEMAEAEEEAEEFYRNMSTFFNFADGLYFERTDDDRILIVIKGAPELQATDLDGLASLMAHLSTRGGDADTVREAKEFLTKGQDEPPGPPSPPKPPAARVA